MRNTITLLDEAYEVPVDYVTPWFAQGIALSLTMEESDESAVLRDIRGAKIERGPDYVRLRLALLEYPVPSVGEMIKLLEQMGGEAANHYELLALVRWMRTNGCILPYRPPNLKVRLPPINSVSALGALTRQGGFIRFPILMIAGDKEWLYRIVAPGEESCCPGWEFYLVRETTPMVPRLSFPDEFESRRKALEAIFGEKKKCPLCGDYVSDEEAYCDGCGTENPSFRSVAFYAAYQEKIEDYKVRECNQGHPTERKDYDEGDEEDRQIFQENPFCSWCGKRFDFI